MTAAASGYSNSPSAIRAQIRTFFRPPDAPTPFFQNLQFTVDPGQIVCVIGLSGVGKSTLVQAILDEPGPQDGGEMDGNVEFSLGLETLSATQIRQRGFLAQLSPENGLLPWRTVRDNMQLPSELNERLARTSLSEAGVAEMFACVGLPPSSLDKFPHELSFGSRQRVTLARGLLFSPRFLLLDEAFTGLDEATVEIVGTTVRDYVVSTNACCVLITHNLGAAFAYGSLVRMLCQQRIAGSVHRSLHECGRIDDALRALRSTMLQLDGC